MMYEGRSVAAMSLEERRSLVQAILAIVDPRQTLSLSLVMEEIERLLVREARIVKDRMP